MMSAVRLTTDERYLQGMTRAKRYANYAGGRKYNSETGKEIVKSEEHAGAKEKLEASIIFRTAWETAKKHDGYLQKKQRFLAEQRQWKKMQATETTPKI